MKIERKFPWFIRQAVTYQVISKRGYCFGPCGHKKFQCAPKETRKNHMHKPHTHKPTTLDNSCSIIAKSSFPFHPDGRTLGRRTFPRCASPATVKPLSILSVSAISIHDRKRMQSKEFRITRQGPSVLGILDSFLDIPRRLLMPNRKVWRKDIRTWVQRKQTWTISQDK